MAQDQCRYGEVPNVSNRLVGFALAIVCFAGPVAAQQARAPLKEGGNPADRAFAAAIRDMTTGMHANAPTGETDQDFVRMMVSYHQAAIAMAKAELRYGRDENLKALARDIVTMQEKEVALMKAWEDRKRGGH